jgi:hypothetical protein
MEEECGPAPPPVRRISTIDYRPAPLRPVQLLPLRQDDPEELNEGN